MISGLKTTVRGNRVLSARATAVFPIPNAPFNRRITQDPAVTMEPGTSPADRRPALRFDPDLFGVFESFETELAGALETLAQQRREAIDGVLGHDHAAFRRGGNRLDAEEAVHFAA